MAAHTPGSWRAVRRADGDVEICAGEDESPLATFYGDDHDSTCWPVNANARLAALAPEMEIAIIQMTNLVQEKIKLEQQAREVISDAIALLKPARPEDGLLPAVRDVMQRIVLAEPAAQRLQAQQGELLGALRNVLDRFSGLCGCKACCEALDSAHAAIAKAEGES